MVDDEEQRSVWASSNLRNGDKLLLVRKHTHGRVLGRSASARLTVRFDLGADGQGAFTTDVTASM
eukprot:4280796-Prymnesium_polylepis.1